jgi:hypothetical protein
MSVRMEQFGSRWADFREILFFLPKPVEKTQFG